MLSTQGNALALHVYECLMDRQGLPLALMAEGERVVIVGLTGGRPLQKRLHDMGLIVGQEITVIQRQGAGAIVAAVGDTRLALGLGVTQKVLVTPIMDEVKS